jgi:hypothetical protein
MDFLNFDRSASSGILIVSGAVIRSCHPCRYFICIYWLWRARVAIAIWQQVWETIWRIIFNWFSLSRGIRRIIFSWVQNQKYKKKLYYRTESFFVHVQQLMTLTVKLKNTLSLKKNWNKIRTIIILTSIMYLDYSHYNNDTIGQIWTCDQKCWWTIGSYKHEKIIFIIFFFVSYSMF